MSLFTKEMVDDYANKLLIGLTEEENNKVLSEFKEIEAEMELISKIPNLKDAEVQTHCLDEFEFIPHDDKPEDGLQISDLLKNCDSYEDREVKVPKVVG